MKNEKEIKPGEYRVKHKRQRYETIANIHPTIVSVLVPTIDGFSTTMSMSRLSFNWDYTIVEPVQEDIEP